MMDYTIKPIGEKANYKVNNNLKDKEIVDLSCETEDEMARIRAEQYKSQQELNMANDKSKSGRRVDGNVETGWDCNENGDVTHRWRIDYTDDGMHYKKQTNTTKLNINQLSEGKIEFQPLKNKNKKG